MSSARIITALLAGAVMVAASCSDADVDDVPAPGGTETETSLVPAPNGTNMGAPPINVGTPVP